MQKAVSFTCDEIKASVAFLLLDGNMFEATGLSETAGNTLRLAGWSPGRRIDTAAADSTLQAAGITVNSAAKEVLAELGGLTLDTPEGGVSYVEFDVGESLLLLAVDDREFLERLVGEEVCPVGYGGRMHVFVTPTGRVVFLHDEWLVVVITSSINDAIEMICSHEFRDYESIEPTIDQIPPGYRDE